MTNIINQPRFFQALRSKLKQSKEEAVLSLKGLAAEFEKNNSSGSTDGTIALARYKDSNNVKTMLGLYSIDKGKSKVTIYDADSDKIKKMEEDIVKADTLESEIKVSGVNVGNLTNGTTLEKGQSIESILREMLMKEIDAKANKPTVSISNTGTASGTYEVGTVIKPVLSHAYTDGKFVGATSDYNLNQAAGCKEGATTYYRGGTALGSNTDTYTLKEETVKYKCTTAYGDDTVEVKTNLGNPSSVKIDAGTATSGTINFIGKRYGYYGGQVESGALEINSTNIKALGKSSFDKFTKIELGEGLKQVVVSFPSSWGSITKVTDDNGMNAPVTTAYKAQPDVTVQGANKEAGVLYKVYIMTSDVALGEIKHTITIG